MLLVVILLGCGAAVLDAVGRGAAGRDAFGLCAAVRGTVLKTEVLLFVILHIAFCCWS